MHKKFDHKAIESKWQNQWQADGLYDVGERDLSKEKEYILVEWPYPSGNLHIGHWYAFAVPDIYARFQKMQGKQVLYPMGFDAFGLPAENAAIKRDVNPKEWTENNIEYMRKQLQSMGAMFAWDKTTSSTDEDYYRWTQWMFTKFFEKGIAYRGKGLVNWCPGCNTVIANEQVLPDGTCERCGNEVEKREMPQWMLRISDYADRLIDDLYSLDWPESIKDAQKNWIGRSNGAEIDFELSTSDSVTVFTTRPDTLFGATYMVLAPEHPLLKKNQSQISNWTEVEAYIKASAKKADQDRLDASKEKTGVKLEGITAINPATKEPIPVFIADYVLASYGTGAIMAVPAHDERDNEFARKYSVEIRPVIMRDYMGGCVLEWAQNNKVSYDSEVDLVEMLADKIKNSETVYIGKGRLINSGEFDGMKSVDAKETITQKVGGRMTNTYRLRDWSVGRQRYWGVPIPIVYDPDGKPHLVPEEHLPWTLPEDVDFKPTGEAPLAKSAELKKRTEDIFGPGWTPEVETLDTFVDSSWYFLRYLDNSNQSSFSEFKRQEEWMPVDTYFGGAEHTTMHLLYSRFWQKALFDLKLVTTAEPYINRINRGLILGPDGNKMSKSKGNVIDPDDHVKTVGADSVKMYLAFMGPYGEGANYPFDLGGIAGIRRFLERVYGLKEHITETETESVTRQLHKTIAKLTTDIPEYKFNTSISALMIFVNLAEKEGLSSDSYQIFLRLLAPFAPHLVEELWEAEGNISSIHKEDFPEADTKLVTDSMVTIGVQINGKMRGQITISPEATEAEALEAVNDNNELKDKLAGGVEKVIYRPGRILSFIVKN